MTAATKPEPVWAVHAWDGEAWHVFQPDDNDRAAADRLRADVADAHPAWGVKLVDETL